MSDRTAAKAIQQAISDFDSIKSAIEGQGVDVPTPTPTRNYASLIASIQKRGAVGNILGSLAGIISENIFKNMSRNLSGTVGSLIGSVTLLDENGSD